VVIGGDSVVRAALELVGAPLSVHPIRDPEAGVFSPGTLDLVDVADLEFHRLVPGVAQPLAGRAAFQYVQKAIEMATAGTIDAIATAPINKEALRAAGVPYIDHTEMLARLTDSPHPMTMFALGNMRVFFLTRHLSLAEACHQITSDLVVQGLQQADRELRRLGFAKPHIAVAALNPHGGEGGLFGREEIEHIAPGVAEARRLGLEVTGPVPADAVFHLNRQGKFDAVLSLYHDQGHIATKTVDFERTVSVTLGLPFLRTSVDHGTAFDIAWKGVASAVGMEESIRVAAELVPLFQR
jgi:4-hydroxythreonine-4-phosphate dehydrogenase